MRIDQSATCAACEAERPQLAQWANDPYCSTECAKKAHGVVMNSPYTSQDNTRTARGFKMIETRKR